MGKDKRIYVPVSESDLKKLKKLSEDDKRSVAFVAAEAVKIGIISLIDRKAVYP